jgi:hypothetical protein
MKIKTSQKIISYIKEKGLVIAVISLLLVVGGVYFYKSNTLLSVENNTDYLTYKNNQYAFSIKYPKWGLQEDLNYQDYSDVFANCPGVKIGGEAQCPFFVEVKPAENVEDFISKLLSQNNLKLKAQIKNEKINNIKTINFITVTNDALEFEEEITIFLGEKNYVLIYNRRPDLQFVNENYTKIISGFNF